jgi:hypothetical protein
VITRRPINQSAGILTRVDPPTQIGPDIAFHFVGTDPRFDVEIDCANGFALNRTLRQRVQQLPNLRRWLHSAVKPAACMYWF